MQQTFTKIYAFTNLMTLLFKLVLTSMVKGRKTIIINYFDIDYMSRYIEIL